MRGSGGAARSFPVVRLEFEVVNQTTFVRKPKREHPREWRVRDEPFRVDRPFDLVNAIASEAEKATGTGGELDRDRALFCLCGEQMIGAAHHFAKMKP